MEEQDKILNDVTQSEYKYGFVTDIETDIIDKGLNEGVIRIISAARKNGLTVFLKSGSAAIAGR